MRLRFPDFKTALKGGKAVSPKHQPPLLPQEIFLVLISVRGCIEPRAILTGRIMPMKNSSATIGNRTCDLPAWIVTIYMSMI